MSAETVAQSLPSTVMPSPLTTVDSLTSHCSHDALINFTVVFVSFVLFHTFSACVAAWCTPASLQGAKSRWRWKNILVSLVHSAASGLWAVSCFYRDPKMAEDMVSTFIPDARYLVAFSFGYFVHDTVDMLRYHPSRQSLELMVHHFVIFFTFGLALWTNLYISYATVALVIEINSIFLHIRQLLQIYGIGKDHPTFRLNSLFNFASYILFRLLTMAWMSRWLLTNKDHPLVSFSVYCLGSVGLAVMTIINIILFYRLLESDLIRPKRQAQVDAKVD